MNCGRTVFYLAGVFRHRYGMGPRVKPEDDEGGVGMATIIVEVSNKPHST